MDATHQRIYDEWVTAGRPGNKHPRSLLELLQRERKANMEQKIKLGDVVRLKSSGPTMTVCQILGDGSVLCRWFASDSGAESRAGCFEACTLKRVPE